MKHMYVTDKDVAACLSFFLWYLPSHELTNNALSYVILPIPCTSCYYLAFLHAHNSRAIEHTIHLPYFAWRVCGVYIAFHQFRTRCGGSSWT